MKSWSLFCTSLDVKTAGRASRYCVSSRQYQLFGTSTHPASSLASPRRRSPPPQLPTCSRALLPSGLLLPHPPHPRRLTPHPLYTPCTPRGSIITSAVSIYMMGVSMMLTPVIFSVLSTIVAQNSHKQETAHVAILVPESMATAVSDWLFAERISDGNAPIVLTSPGSHYSLWGRRASSPPIFSPSAFLASPLPP